MRRARLSDNPKRIPVLDMNFKPRSPLTASAQYIATMMTGQSDRLILLWGREFSSYEEWCARRPKMIRSVRRLLLVTSLSIYRRHSKTFCILQWRISSLCDFRVSRTEREEIAADYASTSWCCIPPGALRDLKLKDVSADSLLDGPAWHEYLFWRAKMVSAQVCDLEWRHGQNRRRCHANGQTRVSTRCASFFKCEAKLLRDAYDVIDLAQPQETYEIRK